MNTKQTKKYLLKELESNDCAVFAEKLRQLFFARASKTSHSRQQ